MKKISWLILVTALATACAVGFYLSQPSDLSMSDDQYHLLLDELMSVETISRPPVPGSSGDTLACIHNTNFGRGIYLVDLKTLHKTYLPLTNDVRRVSGWSPDGRFLAFEQKPPMSDTLLEETKARTMAEDRNGSWLTLYDHENRVITRITTNQAVNETSFVWLNNRSFFLSCDSDVPEVRGTYRGTVVSRSLRRVSATLHEFVAMSDRKAAYLKAKNIYSFEVKDGSSKAVVRKLSDFQPEEFDSIRWLRYSPENGKFLFSARPTNSTWRYCFQFDPSTKAVARLNNEDTYNGQWLQKGAGFAYVGNSNNNFYLAIRTGNPSNCTNLFTEGSVANYTVADGGEKLYATAAIGIEPQSTWEYDISQGKLRQVTTGISKPFVAAKLSRPEQFKVKSFDGLEVPCFVFPPSNPDVVARRRKIPAIIFLPPQTFQMQRVFDTRAQIMANLGFYFIAVNYRGCDGYGRDYAALDNRTHAALDVRAAHQEVIRKYNIDEQKIFLWTSSFGSSAGYELAATVPELWRGIVWIHPVLPYPDDLHKKLPPMFVCSGDQDPGLPSIKEFHQWALQNEVEVELQIYTNAGHVNYNALQISDRQDRVNRFILEHLK